MAISHLSSFSKTNHPANFPITNISQAIVHTTEMPLYSYARFNHETIDNLCLMKTRRQNPHNILARDKN